MAGLTNTMRNIKLKHYLWIVSWWLSLSFVIIENSAIAGISFLFIFFVITTWKKLKNIFLLMIIAALITSFFPPAMIAFSILGVICLILKFKFIKDHYRVLLTGLYMYGVYLFVIILTKTSMIFSYLFLSNLSSDGTNTSLHLLPFVFSGILAYLLHSKIKKLYERGYDTDTVFSIMGITPLVLIGIVLPFVKLFRADFSLDSLTSSESNLDSSGDDINELIKMGMKAGDHVVSNIGNETAEEIFSDFSAFVKILGGNADLSNTVSLSVNNIPSFVHAAMAIGAAQAVFALSEQDNAFKINGKTAFSIDYINDKRANILDENSQKVGTLVIDKEEKLQTLTFNNGLKYTIEGKTNKIFDSKGKVLGIIARDRSGSFRLMNTDNQILSIYRRDGTITDADNNVIGNLSKV